MKNKSKSKEKDNRKDEGSSDSPASELLPIEHAKVCHRYTAVLCRSEDESIATDELDNLQADLEILLAHVAKRMRLITSDGSKSSSRSNSPVHGSKRVRSSDVPNKKFKDSTGKAKTNLQEEVIPSPIPALDSAAATPESIEQAPLDAPRMPRNDLPERFWQSVEPYVTDLGSEHLKVLEQILQSHEDDQDYYKIPALGKHYSIRWAQEDLLEEQKQSQKCTDKKRSPPSPKAVNRALRKAESKRLGGPDDVSPFGSLTQRLIAGLVEENIIAPVDETSANEAKSAASKDLAHDGSGPLNSRSVAKSMNVGNGSQLENRLKSELDELGLLDPEGQVEDADDEDEVLSELKRLQAELETLSQHNVVVTRRLFKQAKEQMQQQHIRRKLVAVDAEIMENWQRLQIARQKKKSLTKKERDSMWRVLKERDTLSRQLNDH